MNATMIIISFFEFFSSIYLSYLYVQTHPLDKREKSADNVKSFFQHDYYDKDSLTENPFLEDDSEHYSDRQNSQQDEEESLGEAPGQHSPKCNEFGRYPDSSGAKESLNKARPLGSKNAKSVTEKASIE